MHRLVSALCAWVFFLVPWVYEFGVQLMQGLHFLIGTAVRGAMFIVLYSRLSNEWSKKSRNLTLIAGQIIFLLAVAWLALARFCSGGALDHFNLVYPAIRDLDWKSEIMAIGKFTTAVQAAKAIKSMLPDSFYDDMKKYVETQVQSVIGKMNLVSR